MYICGIWYGRGGFPGSSDGKESVCNAGDLGSIPGLGRSPGEGNGNPLHILAWRIPWTEEPGRLQWTTVIEITESDMTERLIHVSYRYFFCPLKQTQKTVIPPWDFRIS